MADKIDMVPTSGEYVSGGQSLSKQWHKELLN